jgi:hypothetical protein
MIENGLFLTGSDAELLSRALSEVKAKVYEESETSLTDTQALDALLSSLRTVETEEREKKSHQTYLSPLGKRLMLGKIIGRRRRGQGERIAVRLSAGQKKSRELPLLSFLLSALTRTRTVTTCLVSTGAAHNTISA